DIVIIPNPPHCKRIRITNCPKAEKSLPVSNTINPVTQVAEVEVKRALIKPILFAVLEAEGRLRRIVPIVITTKNPNTNTLGSLLFFLGLSMLFPLLYAFYYQETVINAFILSMAITSLSGLLLWKYFSSKEPIGHKEGFAIATLGWIFAA
ncbi:unnamed protein product, partial [marine sediment metagenome]